MEKNKIHAVLDTNVLISSLLTRNKDAAMNRRAGRCHEQGLT